MLGETGSHKIVKYCVNQLTLNFVIQQGVLPYTVLSLCSGIQQALLAMHP